MVRRGERWQWLRLSHACLAMGGVAWLPPLLLANAPPPTKTALERLDPERRAKVLAALAALVILGFGMVLLAWLGARATRRYMRREPMLFQKPPQHTPVRENDWAEKPLDERSDT
jgi:hypothetical protein